MLGSVQINPSLIMLREGFIIYCLCGMSIPLSQDYSNLTEWHFSLLSVTRKMSNLAFPFCLLLSCVLSLYLNFSFAAVHCLHFWLLSSRNPEQASPLSRAETEDTLEGDKNHPRMPITTHGVSERLFFPWLNPTKILLVEIEIMLFIFQWNVESPTFFETGGEKDLKRAG